jgi:hypothetical protein
MSDFTKWDWDPARQLYYYYSHQQKAYVYADGSTIKADVKSSHQSDDASDQLADTCPPSVEPDPSTGSSSKSFKDFDLIHPEYWNGRSSQFAETYLCNLVDPASPPPNNDQNELQQYIETTPQNFLKSVQHDLSGVIGSEGLTERLPIHKAKNKSKQTALNFKDLAGLMEDQFEQTGFVRRNLVPTPKGKSLSSSKLHRGEQMSTEVLHPDRLL